MMASVPQHNRRGSRAARAIRRMISRALRRTNWKTLGGFALASLCLVSMQAASAGRSEPIQARAPVHIIARGFEQPTGLAIHPHGFLVLTDQDTGVLYRLAPAADGTFRSAVLLAGLKDPYGVVVEPDGHLLIAEKDRGRVVRVAKLTEEVFSAVPEPVVDGLKEPRWLALDGEGAIVVSAEGIKQEKLPKKTPKPKDEVVLRVAPDGTLHVVADGFKDFGGLALDDAGQLFAGAARRRDDKETRGDRIYKIQLPEGPVSPVIAGGFKQPRDLEFDVLGALFFTANEVRAERESDKRDKDDREDRNEDEPGQTKGVILKATFHPDGSLQTLTPFASRLGSPEGLTFDHDGHLYVAESKQGRVLRFQAPAPPVLEPLPPFTRQHSVTIKGTAEPNATLTILGGASPATGLADAHTGAFAIEVSLRPNTEQTLRVYATGARGDGLTSAATEATVTHDDVSPDTLITSGPSGTQTSPTATFTGTDNLTPPAQLRFAHSLDGAPFTPFSTTTTLTLTNLSSGSHTLQIKALDLAENEDPTPAEQTFTVTGLSLTITSPADGASINANRVQVRGTVAGTVGEVGVSVNGFPAQVNNGQWAVETPLVVGPNNIKATATESRGGSGTVQITVNVPQAVSPPLQLFATPEGGLTPLTVRFSAQDQTGRSLVRFELDVEGDGAVDVVTTTFQDVPVIYSKPGLLYPVLKVTDEQGVQYTADTAISVLGREQMDVLLKGKWNGMKAALLASDVEGALLFFAPEQRSRFRTLFLGLSTQISQIAQDMQEIQLISLIENRAKYRLRRTQLYGGQQVNFTYYVYFIQDAAGIWHIEEF